MKTVQLLGVASLSFLIAPLSILKTRAATIAYEGFNYGAGQLAGDSGGTGFTGVWAQGGYNASQSVNYSVATPGLTDQGLATGGNRVFAASASSISGVTRNLASPLGTAGTTRYFSFLMRPEGALGQGAFNGFFGLVLESPTEPELFIGKGGGGDLTHYLMEQRGGGGQVVSQTTAVVGQSTLFVLKAEFLAGNDRFTLFLNPTPGGLEPGSGFVKSDMNIGTVSGLTLYSTGSYSIDELRIGETFADVTLVPEPSGVALGSLGLIFAAWRRRGRGRVNG